MPIGSALKRSWLLVLACVLLCTGAGVAAGLLRQPEYRADAELFVGTYDVRTLALPGFVTASEQLAAAYTRLVVSEPIVVPVARTLGSSPAELRERLSTGTVPGAPVLRIQATGSSRDDAVELVQAISRATAAYVTRLTRRTAEAAALLSRFRPAAARARALEQRATQLRDARAGGEPIPRRRVLDAEAEAETARLRANVLGGLYSEARANSSGAADAHVIQAGLSVKNDRWPVLQRLILLGLASGLVLGAALASLRQRRLVRTA